MPSFLIFIVNLFSLVLLSAPTPTLAAGQGASDAASEPAYVASKPIKRAPPRYPYDRQELAQAGMVEIDMMVDKDGKVFEAVVTDSTHPSFEKHALKAARLYLYEPATLNGMPVESRSEIRILFMIDGAEDAVGQQFAKKYRKVRRALSEEKVKQKDIRKQLDSMTELYGMSLYGLAHLNFAESIYAERFSSKEDQLDALNKILLFEGRSGKKGKFIDDNLEKSVRLAILNIQIALGRYGDALQTYYYIRKKFPKLAETASETMDQVRAVVEGDKPFGSKLTLNENGSHHVRLIKKSFALQNASSEIRELKIRCDRKFAKLEYQTESEYAIPKSWGECYLEVIGEPSLTADLVQF